MRATSKATALHLRREENGTWRGFPFHYVLAALVDAATDTEVDALIADLRRTHYRRPRLQQEFDRAHLP